MSSPARAVNFTDMRLAASVDLDETPSEKEARSCWARLARSAPQWKLPLACCLAVGHGWASARALACCSRSTSASAARSRAFVAAGRLCRRLLRRRQRVGGGRLVDQGGARARRAVDFVGLPTKHSKSARV